MMPALPLPNKHDSGHRGRPKNTWLEKYMWIENSKFEIQLEKDGGRITRQSWMKTSGLWLMFHWK